MRKISFSLAHKYKQFFHCSLLIIHYSLNIYAFSIRTESLKSSKSKDSRVADGMFRYFNRYSQHLVSQCTH